MSKCQQAELTRAPPWAGDMGVEDRITLRVLIPRQEFILKATCTRLLNVVETVHFLPLKNGSLSSFEKQNN